jgi:hypothetical protein
MTSEERLLELVAGIMRGNRPMTDAQIVKALRRRANVDTDARSVRHVLMSNQRRFCPVGSRFNLFRRGVRWRLVEAGPASDTGNAGAPVPARPYRPLLSGAATQPLAFREDDPPTGAIGRAV